MITFAKLFLASMALALVGYVWIWALYAIGLVIESLKMAT